jgi:hypothetical protein
MSILALPIVLPSRILALGDIVSPSLGLGNTGRNFAHRYGCPPLPAALDRVNDVGLGYHLPTLRIHRHGTNAVECLPTRLQVQRM